MVRLGQEVQASMFDAAVFILFSLVNIVLLHFSQNIDTNQQIQLKTLVYTIHTLGLHMGSHVNPLLS